MSEELAITVTINGREQAAQVEPRRLLSDFLREDLALTGTHVGCEQGVCGACTVVLDGEPVRSCLMFAVQADGLSLETIEGLGSDPEALHPVQRGFWERHGLQCGFCTPGMVLTAKALLERNPDPTEDEIREALAGNVCRCTGYVFIVEAVQGGGRRCWPRSARVREALQPATLQPALLGARIKRVEDPRFLTGRARYVDDITRPGMLHVAFVRSTMAHADVTGVDVSAAAELPGVHDVLTGREVLALARPIVCNSTFETWQPTEYPALATDRVRFVGQTVAAVVADDRYVAEDACELVEVDYAPRQPVASVEAAIAPDAPRLHEAWEDNFFIKRHYVGGDPDAAFADAHGVLELQLTNHRHSGIPLENRGCIAEYDPASDALTLWTSTQIPHLVRTGLADSLGMPEHQIRVIAPDVGGGFGIKGHLFPEEIAVCLLARRTGRPVKWIEDRTEHLMASIHAREHHHTLQVAYSADGSVEALRARIYVDCGAYSVYPWTSTMDTGMALGILPGPYRIRHYECEAYSVATNKCPLGPYRGVSRPAACFSIERALDEVAHATGLDPLEVRRRNLVQPDDFPYESVTGLIYDSGSFVESLDKILEDADYTALRRMQEEARSEGRHIGIGFACYTEQTAHTTTEFAKRGVPIIFGYDAATVRMDPSGKVVVHLSTHSHGQGHETSMAQIVADRLGLPLEDVRVAFGDTSSTPYGHGTFASRSAVLGGGACHRASEVVRSRLVRFAAHHLEADEADLVIAEGRISVAGSPSHGVRVSELARWAYHRPEKLPREWSRCWRRSRPTTPTRAPAPSLTRRTLPSSTLTSRPERSSSSTTTWSRTAAA